MIYIQKTKLILSLLLISALWSSISHGNNHNNLPKNVGRLFSLEEKLSRDFHSRFQIKDEQIQIIQKVKVDGCVLNLKTFTHNGLIWSNTTDLRKHHVWKKLIKYQQARAIQFGVSPHNPKNKLYFNSKKDRDFYKKKYKKLSWLCKKWKVKKYLKNNKKRFLQKVPNSVTTFVGNIPLHPSETTGRVYKGAKVSLLEPELSFYERYHAIKNAKKSIFSQFVIYRGDEAGRFFSNEFIKKRQQGLDVKIMVDYIFSWRMDAPPNKTIGKNTGIMYNNLMASGIRVFGYSCDEKMWRNTRQDPNPLKVFRYRDHEKLMIIDNTEAILGGINLANEYFALYGAKKESWRDQDIAVKGPILKEITKSYLSSFDDKAIRYKSYKSDKKCFNPHHPIKEKSKYLKFKKKHTKAYNKYKKEEERDNSNLALTNIENFKLGLLETPSVLGRNYLRRPRFSKVDGARFIHMRPIIGEDLILPAYLDLIKKAKRNIWIANAYLIPAPELKAALIDAGKRGVEVKLLTNSLLSNDLPAHTYVGRTHYLDMVKEFKEASFVETLTEGGIFDYLEISTGPRELKIYEWQGRKENEVELFRGTMHSKFMVVDGKVGLIGSYNLTASSQVNGETALIFDSKKVAKELENSFNNDLTWSKRISRKEMKVFLKPAKVSDRIKLGFYKLIGNLL